VLTAAPLLVDHPHGAGEVLGATLSVLGALLLALARRHPVGVLLVGPPLLLAPLVVGPDPSNYLLLAVMAYAALAAERFDGRAAWVAAGGLTAYVLLVYVVTGEWDSPGLLVLTVPGYLAGTALRLRRRTAEELAERGREIELERDLFAQLSVRNERARIASELHDIVGHAVSVMVVQAAAGQRLVESAPGAAAETLSAIASSARQGRSDLRRLIDLLTGTEVATADLSLVDELVAQASRTGLRVVCRFEGPRDGISAAQAQTAFRVVQEGLTNALRHAPGADVDVLVRGSADGRALTVRVDNGPPPGLPDTRLVGTGRGLLGLRERVHDVGGTFSAGRLADGWRVEASLAR
jgi:signal transduction histidine kinase